MLKNWKWSNIRKVAHWEFFKTLRSNTFLILTFVIPLLIIGAGVIGFFTQNGSDREIVPEGHELKIVVVDKTDSFYPFLEDHLKDTTLDVSQFEGTEREAKEEVKNEKYEGFLLFDRQSLMETGEISYFSEEFHNINTLALKESLQQPILEYRLQELGLSKYESREAAKPLQINTQTVEGHEPDLMANIAELVTPLALAMILIFAVIFTGQVLMYGVIREKKNRIVEILLSSVSSRELMLGKVLGFGTLGLFQVVIWATVGLLVANFFWDIMQFINLREALPSLLIFIFGYLLLASLFATVGATMKEAEGGSQTQGLVIMIPMIPLFISGPIIMTPDAPWVRILSFLPPFNPVASLLRIGATDLPAWELGLIIMVLIISALLVIYLGAKIFEGAILQYDRTLSFGEIRKMFK